MLWALWQWKFTIIIVNSDLVREPEIMFGKRRRLQNMTWGMQQTEVKHCGNTSNVLCTKAFWVIPCKKCIADKPAKKIQHTQALSNKLTQLSITEYVALTRKYPRDSKKAWWCCCGNDRHSLPAQFDSRDAGSVRCTSLLKILDMGLPAGKPFWGNEKYGAAKSLYNKNCKIDCYISYNWTMEISSSIM